MPVLRAVSRYGGAQQEASTRGIPDPMPTGSGPVRDATTVGDGVLADVEISVVASAGLRLRGAAPRRAFRSADTMAWGLARLVCLFRGEGA
jgi:hypothetical protein